MCIRDSYDTVRHTVTSEEAMRMIVARAAADDAREGSRRLEPVSYTHLDVYKRQTLR